MATISNLVDVCLEQHWIALTALGHIGLRQAINNPILLTNYNIVRDHSHLGSLP